jgi:alpha-L-fucosidase
LGISRVNRQPEDGDWYAHNMYMYIQGSRQNKFRVEYYVPPSKFGFKDVIHEWKVKNFHPDRLLAFHKKSGVEMCAPTKYLFRIVFPISSAVFNPLNQERSISI